VTADRSAQLDLVADRHHLVKERGDLAVVEPLDRELDHRGLLGCGCDRVAALRLVAIGRRQPHVDVLARAKRERGSRCELEAHDPCGTRHDRAHDRRLPQQACGRRTCVRARVSHR
jgi:hypothetical protein